MHHFGVQVFGEMVMADYNLFEIADIESWRRAWFNTVNFLPTDTSDNVSDDDDSGPSEENLPNFNRDNQQIHEDEESLRDKLAIDIPPFSASDLRTIRIRGPIHRYLMDDNTDHENHAFRRLVIKMVKSCFLERRRSL